MDTLFGLGIAHLVDGKPDAAAAMFRNGIKIYPLANAANPPAMKFFNGSKKSFNTVHANNFEFYRELAHVIEREPVGLIDPELRGLFASIGIEKGKQFAPDDRMKKILGEAVAVGNATARAIWIHSRDEEAYYYKLADRLSVETVFEFRDLLYVIHQINILQATYRAGLWYSSESIMHRILRVAEKMYTLHLYSSYDSLMHALYFEYSEIDEIK